MEIKYYTKRLAAEMEAEGVAFTESEANRAPKF